MVAPAYTATLTVDPASKNVPQGTRINFSGQAIDSLSGLPVPHADVSVQVKSNGTVRDVTNSFGLPFQADANGNYEGSFTPLPNEAGAYQIGAFHPGTIGFTAEDSFTILGMQFDSSSLSGTVVPGTPTTLSANLKNLSPADLHDLTFTVLGAPSNLSVQVTPAAGATLPGSGSLPVQIVLNATGIQQTQGRIGLAVSSGEGVSATLPMNVSIAPLAPQLVANPSYLQAGMVVGQQSSLSFTVTNKGGAPTDDLTVQLPSNVPFLALGSSFVIPSLAPGQSSTVTLILNPASDLALQEYAGNLVLSSDRVNLSVNYNFRAVSTAVGQVQVTVVDENTVYAANKPNVANAQVTLLDPYTGAIIAQGTTDSTGILTLVNVNKSDTANYGTTNIPQGPYNLMATAAGHDPFRQTITVQPGEVNTAQAYVHLQTVTYTWKVVPSEVQDHYKIVLEASFQTNVPAPVVTVDDPYIVPVITQGEDTQINLTITNHGLIAANNVTINWPTVNGFIFSGDGVGQVTTTAQGVSITVGDLPAMSSIVVPVKLRLADNVVIGQDVATQAINAVAGPILKNLGLVDGDFSASSIDLSNGKVPCFPKIEVLYTYKCVGNELQQVPVNLAPLCVGQKVFKCMQSIAAADGLDWAKTDAGNIAKLGCAVVDVLLKCISNKLSDCTKALIKAGCKGLVGGITGAGGPGGAAAGAIAGIAGAWSDLLKCFCNLTLPDLGTGTVTGTDGGVGVGYFGKFHGFEGVSIPGGFAIPVRMEGPPCGGGGGGMGGMSVAPIVGASYTRTVGTPDPAMYVGSTTGSAQAQDGTPVTGVCAVVRIQIDQQAVITRNAFVGTLQIDNGGDPISNLQVNLNFTTPSSMDMGMIMGDMPANNDFAYADPLLTNITGKVDGTGMVASGQTGSVQYTFIPTEDAAMGGPTTYNIGGSFSYVQDGMQITVPMVPATIEVLPDPKLQLNYFLQRDVIGDDPFTPQVEPSEPFYLGLQVTNIGKGQANNFTITTSQPKIVDNEKGLLINFQIIGTQVGKQQETPSLTADLGTIAPGAAQTAEFVMLSSLQGKFISYSASFEHTDALGKTNTSLIDSVDIHEMIHVINAGWVNDPSNMPFTDDGIPDFLTNDIPDPGHLPDTIWMSDGTQAPVSQSTAVATTTDSRPLTYDLSATDSQGWNYLTVADPTNGQFKLSAVKHSDGLLIRVGDNAWITDRTFSTTDSSFIRENVFHMVDYVGSAGTYTYQLIYTKLDTTPPTIVAVTPVEPDTRAIPVPSLTVTFSKPIDPNSFTTRALTLTLNGGANLINGSVTVTPTDSSDTSFVIGGLAGLTAAPGSYKLLIDPSQVKDASQNFGAGAATELDWVVDTTHAVATVTPAAPVTRNTPVATVNVTFSQPINPTSFTTAALTLAPPTATAPRAT